jgi:hypothetical protein
MYCSPLFQSPLPVFPPSGAGDSATDIFADVRSERYDNISVEIFKRFGSNVTDITKLYTILTFFFSLKRRGSDAALRVLILGTITRQKAARIRGNASSVNLNFSAEHGQNRLTSARKML